MKLLLSLYAVCLFVLFASFANGTSITGDTEFGVYGAVITDFGLGDDQVYSVILQDDGKIAAVGSSFNGVVNNMAAVRYASDGSLDTDFSSDGKVTYSFGSGNTVGRTVVINQSGTLLISGIVEDTETAVFVARLNDAGSLDTTFGTNGVTVVSTSDGDLFGVDMVLGDSGDIFVAGYLLDTDSKRYATVVKLDQDGTVDTGFGSSGILTLDSWGESVVHSIALLENDTLVLGGTRIDGDSEYGFFAGITQAGAMVDSFGENGLTTIQYDLAQCGVADFVVGEDGVIIGAGYVEIDSVMFPAIIRLLADGSVDTTFGVGGLSVLTSSAGAILQAASLYNETSLLLAGYIESGGKNNIFLALGSNGAGTIDSEGDIEWVTQTVELADDSKAASIIQSGQTDFLTGGAVGNGADDDFGILQYSISQTTADDTISEDETSESTTDSVSVTTDEINQITGTSGSGGGVVYGSDDEINLRGVCYSIEPSPEYTEDDAEDEESTEEDETASNSPFSTSMEDSGRAKGLLFAQYSASGKYDRVESGCTEDGSGAGSFSSTVSGIIPGTLYYVRAYAVLTDESVVYGNEVSFKTTDACFIATAIFGSILDGHVVILRNFRDQVMKKTSVGRGMIYFYYEYSPILAEKIHQSLVLRIVMRVILIPIIGLCYILLHIWLVPVVGAALFVLGMALYMTRSRIEKKLNGV